MTYSPDSPPLRFVAPAGWPTPAASWVARNQGWQPPIGWVPPTVDGAPRPVPAPAGWQFWAPEPTGWATYRAPFAKVAQRATLIGAVMLVVGTVITVAGYLGEFGSSFFILWGLMVFGAIRLVSGLIRLAKVDATAREGLTASALNVRRQLDTAAYPAYLDSTARERAETGRPAMSIDEFAVARDQEPWGAAGWSRSEGAPDPALVGRPSYSTEAYGAVPSTSPWAQSAAVPAARSGRRGIVIAAVVVGGLVVVGAGLAIPSLMHGANASNASSVSNGGTGAGVGTGNYDLPDDAWNVVDTTSPCSSSAGCWQIEITPVKDCAATTIVWGFANTKTGNDKATRSTRVALTAGSKASITIPVEGDLSGLKYIFYDRADCAG